MKAQDQDRPATRSVPGAPRSEPRFPLVVDVTVRSRTRGVLTGYTDDISESGISAMLRVDVPVSEIVELNFTLPIGQVKVHAIVRQRDCFRYGFQFLESATVQEIIRNTCRQLAEKNSSSKPASSALPAPTSAPPASGSRSAPRPPRDCLS